MITGYESYDWEMCIHGEMEVENHPRYGKKQGDMSNASGVLSH